MYPIILGRRSGIRPGVCPQAFQCGEDDEGGGDDRMNGARCDGPSPRDCRTVPVRGRSRRSHLTPAASLFPSMVRHKDDGCSKEKDVKSCPWDAGCDGLASRLSILDRLLHTHPVWLQLSLSEEEAAEVLQSQPPGVRRGTTGRAALLHPSRERLGVLESSLQPVGNTASDA